jgi:hypothetical protein
VAVSQDFHDATLIGVELLWAEGVVTIRLDTAAGPTEITVEGVTHLDCPRSSPWGRSVSINEVVTTATELKIEMQSGDTLHVHGTKVVLAP